MTDAHPTPQPTWRSSAALLAFWFGMPLLALLGADLPVPAPRLRDLLGWLPWVLMPWSISAIPLVLMLRFQRSRWPVRVAVLCWCGGFLSIWPYGYSPTGGDGFVVAGSAVRSMQVGWVVLVAYVVTWLIVRLLREETVPAS